METSGYRNMVMDEIDDAELVGFVANDLRTHWAEILPLLERAVSHSEGYYSVESVVAGLFDTTMGMFAIRRRGKLSSILVWAISEYDTGLNCFEMLLLGGERRQDWIDLDAELDAFAKKKGCSRRRVVGRKGWLRELKDWKMVGVVLERSLA